MYFKLALVYQKIHINHKNYQLGTLKMIRYVFIYKCELVFQKNEKDYQLDLGTYCQFSLISEYRSEISLISNHLIV